MTVKSGDIKSKIGQERKKVNVLFTSDALSIAGIRSLILDLVVKLDKKRFQCAVAVIKSLKGSDAFYNAELTDRNVPVKSLSLSHPQALFPIGVKRMKRIIAAIDPDVICTSLLTDCFFVVRAAASSDIPIISLFRGAADLSGLSRFKKRILLDHLEFSDGIIALSEHAKKSYPRESATPIAVLPPMIDVSRFSPTGSRSFGAKQELTIGAVMTAKDETALPMLIEIFGTIRNRLPFVKRLIIAGEGSNQASVKQVVSAFGISESVELLGPQEDIAAVYRRMDFLLSITEQESMGMAVLEAMSSRVIPIVGENCLMPDIIINGKNGFYITHKDLEGTARMLEGIFVDCVRNPAKFNKIAKAAREAVQEKFSSETVVPRYEELFLRIAMNRESAK